MKLKIRLETLDGLDAAFHDLYTEQNGAYVLTGVEGLKTQEDVDRLQQALQKERADHKRLRERYSVFNGREVDDILADLDRIDEYKQAADGKLDDTKLNNLVEARLKSRMSPLERERDMLSKQLKETQDLVTTFQQRETTRTIHDAARAALTKSTGFLPTATEDVLLYAERMLEVDERGNVVTRDAMGVTPGIDATVWLQEMQSKKPYWWGSSVGGGAGNGRVTGSGIDNPWTAANWNMTKQGQIYREDPRRAEQLARSAGTTIGGPKPSK